MASPEGSPATKFRIGSRRIGADEPVFVIAEAGVNHNGDVELAHRLVDVAADCGADAVKFQTFDADALVSDDAEAAPYQRERGAQSQAEMLRSLGLPKEAWAELASHARDLSLTFLSTAFDLASLDLLLGVGVEVLKAPSGELDNLAFLRELASHRLPLIVSTGLGTLDEVAAALDAAAAAPVALLHCVTAYPAPVEESNLRALTTMSARFRVPVGWSDHTAGCLTAVGAVALGACILEKHLTLDHSMPGPDHAASADPAGFGEYVRSVRQVEAALGDGEKRPTPTEAENRVHARRSHHARRDLHPGDVLTAADVMLLRPATGIPASMGVTGRMVARSVLAGNALLFEDLE